MIRLIISGGQTGVDQAAWRAAKLHALRTGGWMPQGYMTEEGPRPEFADLYGAKESRSNDYKVRTYLNAQEADATLWIGPTGSPGWKVTWASCCDHQPRSQNRRPLIVVDDFMERMRETYLMAPIRDQVARIARLNVAGSRESRIPGIGQQAEDFLNMLFREIDKQERWLISEHEKRVLASKSKETGVS